MLSEVHRGFLVYHSMNNPKWFSYKNVRGVLYGVSSPFPPWPSLCGIMYHAMHTAGRSSEGTGLHDAAPSGGISYTARHNPDTAHHASPIITGKAPDY